MQGFKEVKAIVRSECVPDLLRALRGAEISRFFISRIHVLGHGVVIVSDVSDVVNVRTETPPGA